MMLTTWTPERVEQLQICVNAGLTCSQIADEIGVSRNAVIGKIHRLGLSMGRAAAAPARASPPRDRRPRFSQRQVLRMVSVHAAGCEPAAARAPRVESTRPCSLLELAHGKCRWPLSEQNDGDFAFCGNDSLARFSYCVGHAHMAYRVPARRRA